MIMALIIMMTAGTNAFFTYSVVGWRGTGTISYEAAITAIMIDGIIILALVVTGIGHRMVRWIPEPVKTATPAAIGAFLAHLGLQTAEGIGIVVSDIATAVTLGACPEDKRVPIVALTEACKENPASCVVSDAYTCDDLGGVMTSGTAWLGILGLMIMSIMLAYKSNFAFIAGIALITVISWFRDTAVTYFPDTDAGNARFDYFTQVVSVEPLDKLLLPFTSELGQVGVAMVTFLYIVFLDTSGTLLALTSNMEFVEKGDENDGSSKDGTRWAFAAASMSTIFGSMFGLSPFIVFMESGSGIAAGSRTGLTSVFCAFFFFLSIFFAPIISSIPPWATGGILILVGSMMCGSLAGVKWYNPTHALAAFLTVIMMPLTYSIAYGLIAGIGSYMLMEGTFLLLSKFGVPRPEFSPPPSVETLKGTGKEEDENSEDGDNIQKIPSIEDESKRTTVMVDSERRGGLLGNETSNSDSDIENASSSSS